MSKDHFQYFLELCKNVSAVPTAIAHPCGATELRAALEAQQLGLIEAILVGPAKEMEAIAKKEGINIGCMEIENIEGGGRASAIRSVELVHEGRAGMLMKGNLHTDELLAAVASSKTGLRTNRRMSHVFAMNVPTYHKPLFVTDAVVNIAPELEQKVDICQNAIDLLNNGLRIKNPKVAVLSAVETVNSKIQSTLDAAALTVMAMRGQIVGGIVDGPLAFDNAISAQAAKTKGIKSEVAGDPDILLVPTLEAGNILFKQLVYLANSEAAGIVLGARVPVALTSRADSATARIASCALCVLQAHATR
ncbi:MAG: bifunctional enoyl-CoA hydratase/phosphate acetyltransferase [Saezia sp.]